MQHHGVLRHRNQKQQIKVATTAPITLQSVFELVREDLLAIEREFGSDTASDVEVITEIGEYLRNGGGKRIRPALLLLSAKLCGYKGQGAIRLGAVVEIIHTATLVHDDIIDEAQMRRGRPSTNHQWGNSRCVLAGDWLYMDWRSSSRRRMCPAVLVSRGSVLAVFVSFQSPAQSREELP